VRAGVFTLALSLIGLGGALLATNLGYLRLVDVLRWWPVIILLLGAEILIRQSRVRARGGPAAVVWDRVATVLVVLLCLALAGAQGVAAVWEQVGAFSVWETGWFPTVKADRTLTGTMDVDGSVTALEILSGAFRSIQVVGGSERVEAEASVSQPGRDQGEATRLAEEWQLRLEVADGTVFVRLDRPAPASTRTRGSCRLLVRVPSRLAVRITNQHGDVDVRGVAGCRISNRFGQVSVTEVPGAVEVVGEQGPVTVTASGSKGAAVTVENRFGAVEIRQGRGPVRVRNRHGEVRAEWEAVPGSECRLETEFGPMEVVLPAGAAVRLDAETSFGKIEVPAEWNVHTESSGTEYAAARGTVGHDGFALILRNRHGPIRIRLIPR